MQVLATWAPEDGILGAVAPLGLAAYRGHCLVVDLDESGPNYPGDRTLADLVSAGPTRNDLSPAQTGLAVLRNGGVGFGESRPVILALLASWPAVVLRLPANPIEVPWPVIKVRPLLPGNLFGKPEPGIVYQRSGWNIPIPAGALALPVPRPGQLAALLAGNHPRRSGWVKAWGPVWERRGPDRSWG